MGAAIHGCERPPFFARPAVVLGLFLAALLWLALTLEHNGLWLDEISSLQMADPTQPLTALLQGELRDRHPPLYFVLLRCWQQRVGTTDGAVRALSLCAFAAVGALLALAYRRRLLGAERGYVALLLLTSSGVLFHAQQARPYAFALLAALAVMLSALSVRAAVAAGRSPSAWSWLGLLAAALIGSLFHYFALLYVGVVLLVLTGSGLRRRRYRPAALTAGIGALTLAPSLAWIVSTRDVWLTDVGVPGGTDVVAIVREFIGLAFSYNPLLLAIGGWALVHFFAGWREDHAARWVALTVAMTLVLAAALSGVKPVIRARNLIVLLPGIYYLLAAALVGWADRPRRRWVVAGSFALSMALAVVAGWLPVEQWRESAQFVMRQEGCHQGTVLAYPTWRPYVYHRRYLERSELRLRAYDLGLTPAMRDQPCPVILWAGHLDEAGLQRLLTRLDVEPAAIRIERFQGVYVVVRAR